MTGSTVSDRDLCYAFQKPPNHFFGVDVMPMTDFLIADGVVLLVLAAFFLRSFFHGALKEIFSLVSLGTGYLAAGKYGGLAQSWVEGWTGESRWFSYAGYVGLFIAVWFLIGLAGKLISSLVQNSALGGWDRVGGGLIGLVKGGLIVSSVVVLLDLYIPAIPLPSNEESRVMPYVRQVGTYVREAATWDIKGKVEEIKNAVGAGEGSSEKNSRK